MINNDFLILDVFWKNNQCLSELHSIASHLKIIADNSSSSRGWDLLLVFIGVVLGAGITFLTQWFFQKRAEQNEKAKIREDQFRSLNTALVSFHCGIDTLSFFKENFIKPYKDELKRIEEAKKVHIEDPEKAYHEIVCIWNKMIIVKQYFPYQTFDETNYATELMFIVLNYPSYFNTFHKVREHLLQINPTLKTRNDFIQNEDDKPFLYQEYNNGVEKAISVHPNWCNQLESLVNKAWIFLQCGIDHLENYAGKFFKDRIVYKHTLSRVTKMDEESKGFMNEYKKKIECFIADD